MPRESEGRYRELVKESPLGVFQSTPGGRFLSANPAFAQALGFKDPETLVSEIRDFSRWYVDPAQREELKEDLERYGKVRDYEIAIINRQGKRIHLSLNMRLAKDKEGRVSHYDGFAIDVTKRFEAEEALKKSEERLQLAMDSVNDGIWDWRVDSGEVYFNPMWYTMLGYEPYELPQEFATWQKLLHPEDRDRVERIVMDHLQSAKSFEFENRMRTKSGEWKWILARGKTVEMDALGQARRMLGTHMDITERKRAEEELERSNQRLKQAQRIGGIGDWMWDPKSDTVTWSENLYHILGLDPGQPPPDYEGNVLLYHPDDQAKFRSTVTAAVEQGRSFSMELRRTRPDGREITIISHGDVKKNAQGDIESLYGIALDITERKRIERELAQTVAILEAAMDNSTAGIAIADAPNGRLRYVNAAGLGIRAGEREELVDGVDIDQYVASWQIHHMDGTPYKPEEVPLARAVLMGETCSEEFMIKRPGGEWRVVLANAAPILDEQGQVVAGIVVFLDITDRKAVENALVLSEARLKEAQKAAHIGSWDYDAKSDRLYWSDELYRLLEYEPEEVKASYDLFMSYVEPEPSDIIPKSIKAFLEPMDRVDQVFRIRTRSGVRKFFHSIGTIEKDKDGKLIRAYGTTQDITERRLAEEEAKIREQQLIQADKMISLGILAAGVAHEINNPNNFIAINAPLVKTAWEGITPVLDSHQSDIGDFTIGRLRYSRLREHVPALLDGIIEGSQRIKRITKDMKDFVRQDSEGMSGKIDVNEVVGKALNLLSNKIKKATHHLQTDLAEKLPLVSGNAQRLEQVVLNVMLNAAEALPDMEKRMDVSTRHDREKQQVVVKVRDEGEGIDSKDMERIFDPFFTTKRSSGGTGLGLSISMSIVKAHGGDLVFASNKGKGTTAEIRLPAMQERKNGAGRE